jgi:phage-related protein
MSQSHIEQPWTIEFFTTENGTSPVLEFIEALPIVEQSKIKKYFDWLLLLGTTINYPKASQLRGHEPLWELRPIPNRIIYFAYSGKRFVILHGFRKTSNKTPLDDLRVAKKRYREFLERES